MDCRDVRDLADSFLAEELLMETNHEMLRHLAGCQSCRSELAERRSIRDGLRRAFADAAFLEVRPEFSATLHATLRQAALEVPARRRFRPRAWWALAAALLLAATVGLVQRGRDWIAMGALARAAVGDHRDCALQFRLTEKPIPLEEAATRYGLVYRVLEQLPPAHIRTPSGSAHVLERHACIYRGQRFAHIVFDASGGLEATDAGAAALAVLGARRVLPLAHLQAAPPEIQPALLRLVPPALPGAQVLVPVESAPTGLRT